jgi:hypothetical protein
VLGPAHPFRRPPRAPLLSRLFCALAPLCASQELRAKLRQTCDPEDRKRRAEAKASWISPSPPALLPAADLPCASPLRAQAVAKREAALREREEAVAAAAAEYKPRYKPRTKKAARTEVRAPAPRLLPRHLLLLRLPASFPATFFSSASSDPSLRSPPTSSTASSTRRCSRSRRRRWW